MRSSSARRAGGWPRATNDAGPPRFDTDCMCVRGSRCVGRCDLCGLVSPYSCMCTVLLSNAGIATVYVISLFVARAGPGGGAGPPGCRLGGCLARRLTGSRRGCNGDGDDGGRNNLNRQGGEAHLKHDRNKPKQRCHCAYLTTLVPMMPSDLPNHPRIARFGLAVFSVNFGERSSFGHRRWLGAAPRLLCTS